MVSKIKDKVKAKVQKVKAGTKRPNPHDSYFQNMNCVQKQVFIK